MNATTSTCSKPEPKEDRITSKGKCKTFSFVYYFFTSMTNMQLVQVLRKPLLTRCSTSGSRRKNAMWKKPSMLLQRLPLQQQASFPLLLGVKLEEEYGCSPSTSEKEDYSRSLGDLTTEKAHKKSRVVNEGTASKAWALSLKDTKYDHILKVMKAFHDVPLCRKIIRVMILPKDYDAAVNMEEKERCLWLDRARYQLNYLARFHIYVLFLVV